MDGLSSVIRTQPRCEYVFPSSHSWASTTYYVDSYGSVLYHLLRALLVSNCRPHAGGSRRASPPKGRMGGGAVTHQEQPTYTARCLQGSSLANRNTRTRTRF